MGSVLMGGQKSGTPLETRGGSEALGAIFQNLLQQGGPGALSALMGRGASESSMNMLGFDPAALGLGDIASSVLADPSDATAGLFRSMQPFEAEETARQVAGMRGQFGTMGGRFSRNAGAGEADLRQGLAGQFGMNRENALLSAGGQRANALMGILGAATQARQQAFGEQMQPLQMMSQFLAPGAPQFQEGILPGLIGMGGTLAMASMMGPPGVAKAAGSMVGNQMSRGTPAFIPSMPFMGNMPTRIR
jgi:hypothetical protein